MKRNILSLLILSVSPLLAPLATAQSANNLSLPVSEMKLCRDWFVTFQQALECAGSDVADPGEYLLYDIDGDGRAEVLMRQKENNWEAMLSYDAEGRMQFVDCTSDGYLSLGVAPGWYVRQFDDHMNEYRSWTSYFYRVEQGKFDFIGHKMNGINGLDDEGEYKWYSEDETGGKAPADSLITFLYDLTGWQSISQEALDAYSDHFDDWDDMPFFEAAESAQNGYEDFLSDPDAQAYSIATEFTLDNGTRGRLDMLQDRDSKIVGWTTYYRKNGSRSRINFFGARYYDGAVGQEFIELHEYYNGKCCGHMKLTVDETRFESGTWMLKGKELQFTEFTPVDYDLDNQPALASPASDPDLADKLLPCSRQVIRDRLLDEYDELEGDIEFMLYDMNHDGIFEILLRYSIGSRLSNGIIWMNNGQPELICGGSTPLFMSINAPVLFVTPVDDDSSTSPYEWTWASGHPEMNSLDENEAYFLERYTHGPTELGEWCKLPFNLR